MHDEEKQSECSPDNPLGGSLERYDMARDEECVKEAEQSESTGLNIGICTDCEDGWCEECQEHHSHMTAI